MNEKGLKLFWLGMFIIGALALVTWLLLFLRPSFGDGKTELHLRFTNIEKVSIGTRVTYAGKPVGTVVAINEIFNAREQPADENGNYYFYELVLRVDSSVKVYDSDQITFTTMGLLGEKSIAIFPKQPAHNKKSKEITSDVLYVTPSATFEQALTQLAEVKDVFIKTLDDVDQLITENKVEFRETLLAVTKVSDELTKVMKETLDSNLIPNLGRAAQEFADLAYGFNHSDNELYCQLSQVICEMRHLIYDMRNYGLLFQYNKKWQRKQLQQCWPEQ